MLEAHRSSLRRAGLHSRSLRRSSSHLTAHGEAHLGTVIAQARRVAAALTLVVAIGVAVGCLQDVGSDRYAPRAIGDTCGECPEPTGRGLARQKRAEDCEPSRPFGPECNIDYACTARVQCATDEAGDDAGTIESGRTIER